MSPEAIASRVQSALSDAEIELTGEACSFSLLVVSEQLTGWSPVARQRLLLGLFAAELASGALHALSIRALTRAELRSAGDRQRVPLQPLTAAHSSLK